MFFPHFLNIYVAVSACTCSKSYHTPCYLVNKVLNQVGLLTEAISEDIHSTTSLLASLHRRACTL